MGFEVDLIDLFREPNATDKQEGLVKVESQEGEETPHKVPSTGTLNHKINRTKEITSTVQDTSGTPGGVISIDAEVPKTAFFGDVSDEEFISGESLASWVMMLNEGTLTKGEIGWLKFKHQGKILFVAKKQVVMGTTWQILADKGLVYGNKTINIKGKEYKIRLLRGIGEDVQPDPKVPITYFTGEACHKSEWNMLMCPINDKAPNNWFFPGNVLPQTDRVSKTYESYTIAINQDTICQDTVIVKGEEKAVKRGGYKACPSHSLYHDKNQSIGWRPVLELVDSENPEPYSINIVNEATPFESGKVKVSKEIGEGTQYTVPTTKKTNNQLANKLDKNKVTFKYNNKRHISKIVIEDGVPVLIVDPCIPFQRVVKGEELISEAELSKKVGLTSGTVSNVPTEWLKFQREGKTLYVAKTNLRHTLPWASLHRAGIIYGNKTIEIKGNKYIVRLLRGVSEDIQPDPEKLLNVTTAKGFRNSEWSDLMYPISEESKTDNWASPNNVESPIEHIEKPFTKEELGTFEESWCQETNGFDNTYRTVRGGQDSSSDNIVINTRSRPRTGWRPVLELVEE